MKNKLQIVEVPINDLKPADYNPRKWDQKSIAELKESMTRFGMVDPIVVNGAPERHNIVIGGHFRMHIAKELGYIEVPVVYIDIPEVEKEKELNLRLNRNTGAFDYDLLVAFGETMLLDVGFTSNEMDKMFGLGDEDEDEFDPDEAFGSKSEPDAKVGDVYALGRHRLMCGDATKAEDVAKLMEGAKADLVFTDPPYNVDYEGGGSYADNGKPKREKIENDKMSAEDFRDFLSDAIKNMLDHCNGVFYICMSSKELSSLKDVFEQNGGHWQAFIIWVKNTFTLSRSDWQNQYEPILYGWNGNKINHYFVGFRDEGNVWENLETLKPQFDGEKTTIKIGDQHLEIYGRIEGRVCRKKDCVDIWREKKPNRSKEHPTMKPIKLVVKAIKASSQRDETILDVFGGSGSTLIAAEKTGRICRMMEYEPKYVDVTIARWEKETGEKAQKIN
ncbi:MAG: site-specific DNA-methyltransferase [Candidatus Nomurabacteria bacterium]|nr:site-specific DNA-methyltransferase [Candidatus Nomurabacteria bacterium]MCX6788460.1 site-specific DNA-methyltransferase [Candidatus Jorgensenbacteria bacterium]